MRRLWPLLFLLGLGGCIFLVGCVGSGIQRCYGIKVPFVIVGPCFSLGKAEAPRLDPVEAPAHYDAHYLPTVSGTAIQ